MITELRTDDSAIIFTPNYSTSFFDIDRMYTQNNNVKSDTQGFMRKVQIGDTRVVIECTAKGTKAEIETTLLLMLTYPLTCQVTLDRNIMTKSVSSMECVIDDYEVIQEFDDGNEYEVKLILIEVL